MLSDIQHLDNPGEINSTDEDVDDEDSDDGLNDEAWEKYEQEKDLSGIVQIEDEDDDEE